MNLLRKIINFLALSLMIIGSAHLGLSVFKIKALGKGLIPLLCNGWISPDAIFIVIGLASLWGVYMLFF